VAQWWRERFAERPWWMNLLMAFCGYMALIHMPVDFFLRSPARAEEVWLGIVFRGWAAKLTEPLHWAIFAVGAYGFWRRRPWMWPWASLYVWQVSFAMLVWWIVYRGGFLGFLLALISAALFAAIAIALWRAKDHFQRPRETMRQRYGEWALVTGASAGIGEEFARALAQEGMSCVLTARREDRLRGLAAELERLCGVATRVVSIDLADPSGADRLCDAVADLEISLVVANAGFGFAGRFEKQDTARLRDMIQVNCVAPVVLAKRLVPPMRARRRGALIVSGSIAGRQAMPRHAIYAGTKAFDQLFGEALWAELRGTGVDVLVVEPGPTATEFRQVAGETHFAGEPASDVVALALDAVGHQPSVIHGWFNWARAKAVAIVPRSLAILVTEDFVLQQTPEEMR